MKTLTLQNNPIIQRGNKRKTLVVLWILILFFLSFIIKLISFKLNDSNTFLICFGIVGLFYFFYKLTLSLFYSPKNIVSDNYKPMVSFVIPCKNEEKDIEETLYRIAASNYPKDKIEIITINDGSTDDTLINMRKAEKELIKKNIFITIIDWKTNKGKREGMAAGIKLAKGALIVFIDSDSFIETDTLANLVKYFNGPSIGAVAGHTDVYNKNTNNLTKIQDAMYYLAYKVNKSAEGLFGSVMCCSGCCVAYRKDVLNLVLDKWMNQTFLGAKSTFGDDRSLTNLVLAKGFKTLYAHDAQAYTIAPETLSVFVKQQLRWKKSWVIENIRASLFMWKKNPAMSILFYLGFILPFISFAVSFKLLILLQDFKGKTFIELYLCSFLIIGLIYITFYKLHKRSDILLYGLMWSTFYSVLIMFQLPWAIINLRDSKWGTR